MDYLALLTEDRASPDSEHLGWPAKAGVVHPTKLAVLTQAHTHRSCFRKRIYFRTEPSPGAGMVISRYSMSAGPCPHITMY